MITSRPWEISSPRSSSERRNGVNTCAFSVSVSNEAQEAFFPAKRDAQSHDHRCLGECLPIQKQRHRILAGRIPFLHLPQLRSAPLHEPSGHR